MNWLIVPEPARLGFVNARVALQGLLIDLEQRCCIAYGGQCQCAKCDEQDLEIKNFFHFFVFRGLGRRAPPEVL